jgi:hypothetical protein
MAVRTASTETGKMDEMVRDCSMPAGSPDNWRIQFASHSRQDQEA